MNITDFKIRTINKLYNMIDSWFDTTIQDGFINGILKSIIKSNQDKYDDMLNIFVDSKGQVDLSELYKQLDKNITNDIELDLKEIAKGFNIPSYIVPNKVLFLTKNDILDLIK